VIYVSAYKHVHEMSFPMGGGSWALMDLTTDFNAPQARPGTALMSSAQRF
jgi:hypothetical protein